MAKFSDYEIPDDHPSVISGHISSGDTVPFLIVTENERGVAGYAFTPRTPTWVENFKTDDDVAQEEAEKKAQRDAEAKQANLDAARNAQEYKESEPPSAASLREPDDGQALRHAEQNGEGE